MEGWGREVHVSVFNENIYFLINDEPGLNNVQLTVFNPWGVSPTTLNPKFLTDDTFHLKPLAYSVQPMRHTILNVNSNFSHKRRLA
jgi:hypothetical protein